jgi:outer membrane lipoprotein SlyB
MPNATRLALSATALLLGLAGCATHVAPARTAAARQPASQRGAIIVSARPLGRSLGQSVGGSGVDVRRSILSALAGNGVGGNAAGNRAPAGATEFIVRQDGGETLSVVQADDPGLRPGARVLLRDGPHTRLIRVAGM